MPEYDVQTPLEQQWVTTPEAVRDVIARYMATEGASLNNVSVVEVPEGRIGTGAALNPTTFWQPADE